METEGVDLVRMIVDTYVKDGASEALKLTRNALDDQDHQVHHRELLPVLHRLHAMYVFESDRWKVDLNSALKSANKAVLLYPRSLEYRFFYISLLHGRLDSTDVTGRMLAAWECEEALKVYRPREPYWELYMYAVDEKAAGVKSGEEAVGYVKIRLLDMINRCYREFDDLPQIFLDAIRSPSLSSHEKMTVTGDMIKSDYYSCPFVQRMHSEFCFESAMEVEDMEERKKLLDQAYCSAKIAFVVFRPSMDYEINFFTRDLQRSGPHFNSLQWIKENLTQSLGFSYFQEPYYRYLVRNDTTDLREQKGYYKNCFSLLLIFVRTLEERRHNLVSQIYYKHLNENQCLRNLADRSEYFQKNIRYLLNNIPINIMSDENEVEHRRRIEMQNNDADLIEQIVDTYKRGGASEALKLTRDAVIRKPESSLLLRLHAEYIFETDRSEIESALAFAKKAVHLLPVSLEYRFFHASLLYSKAVTAGAKDNLLYGEIMSECDDALHMTTPSEPLWALFMVDDEKMIRSEEEALKYVKNRLHNLLNKCLRMIDALPKTFLEDMLPSSKLGSYYKLGETCNLMSSSHRFCAFVHRLHSEICFELGSKFEDSEKRKRWVDGAFISGRTAHEFLKGSIEYAVNYHTRTLQHRFDFSRNHLQLMKDTLAGLLRLTGSQEPYYRYFVNNNLTDIGEQMEYCQNCVRLVLAFIATMEEVVDRKKIEENLQEVDGEEEVRSFLQTLVTADLDGCGEDLRSFAEKSEFFDKNIKYLLVNNLHKMNIHENEQADGEDLADKGVIVKSEEDAVNEEEEEEEEEEDDGEDVLQYLSQLFEDLDDKLKVVEN